MDLLIRNARLNGQARDIAIAGGRITAVAPRLHPAAGVEVVEADRLAALPGLMNAHSHAAMTLLRGYGDDLPLRDWLQNKIWPAEARLDDEAVYWGTRLACLEMVKSGTTFFFDMYWRPEVVVRAAIDAGLRALVAPALIDSLIGSDADKRRYLEAFDRLPGQGTVRAAFGPHAIYTVSSDNLLWAARAARERGRLIHIHLSETETEVKDCLKTHGCRPVEYLDRIGFLGPDVIVAHALWLERSEIEILEKNEVKIAHCPVSNQKLSSGIFPYGHFKRQDLVLLGTDGAASNNSLDMFREMRAASLLQKISTRNPQALPAAEVLALATRNCARALGLGQGEIRPGATADLILVDLDHESMVPLHSLESNLVYAATGAVVDTVICDGRILMKSRQVPGEDEVIAQAREAAARLIRG